MVYKGWALASLPACRSLEVSDPFMSKRDPHMLKDKIKLYGNRLKYSQSVVLGLSQCKSFIISLLWVKTQVESIWNKEGRRELTHFYHFTIAVICITLHCCSEKLVGILTLHTKRLSWKRCPIEQVFKYIQSSQSCRFYRIYQTRNRIYWNHTWVQAAVG